MSTNLTENPKPDTTTETQSAPLTRADHSDAMHLHASEIDANLVELHAAFLAIEEELSLHHLVTREVKIVQEKIARIHLETAHMRRALIEATPAPVDTSAAKHWDAMTFTERLVFASGPSPAGVLWSCAHDLRTTMGAAEAKGDDWECNRPNVIATLDRVTMTIEAVAAEVAKMTRDSEPAPKNGGDATPIAQRSPVGTLIEDVNTSVKAAIGELESVRYRFNELFNYAGNDADAAEDFVEGSRALHALYGELTNIEGMTFCKPERSAS